MIAPLHSIIHGSHFSRAAAFLLVGQATVSAQNFVDLDFTRNVQPNNAIYPNQSTLGPEYFSGLTLNFQNVAFVDGLSINVDARVSIVMNHENGTPSPASPGYDFVGYIPDYDQAVSGPEGDLGVYYRYNGDPLNLTGGISYTISFYESGSDFTIARTLSDVRFLIYDHDGETGQSESIRTYVSDGFTGYQLGDLSGIHTHDEGHAWRFDSRGAGHPEDSAVGGFIAYYQNTSSIRFDLFSTSASDLPYANYGIFAAFDGDLSLIGGDTSGFTPMVPEPSTPLLVMTAASLALLRRGRPQGN